MESALSLAIAAGLVAALAVARYLLDRRAESHPGFRVRAQLLFGSLALVIVFAIILVLPIDDERRGQLLTLLGILLSAAVALSSTTYLGNAMAGLMLRAMRRLRPGDWLACGDFFGRVTDRGLFHIEIQTESRDLTSIPNLYLAQHPITGVLPSGTVVSADVSLGYDVPWQRAESLLLLAAAEAGLADPFVSVRDLGDFAVTYRIAGLLTRIDRLVSTRSTLRKAMLDALHDGGVEIASPAVVATRALARGVLLIPGAEAQKAVAGDASRAKHPERMMFDKADEAASLERLKEAFDGLASRIEEQRATLAEAATPEEKAEIGTAIERMEARRNRLAELVARRQAEKESGK